MKALLLALVLAASSSPITVKTRDGRTVTGNLVSETDRGFLIATETETVMVTYGEVLELERADAPPKATPTPSTPAPLAEPEKESSRIRLGAGGGAFGLRTFTGSNNPYGFGVQATFIVDVDFGRLGLRFAPTFFGGVTRAYSSNFDNPIGLALLDLQLRVLFTRMFSSGIGVFTGVELGTNNGFGQSVVPVVGPSLTLLAVHFGARRQHEVQLWAGVAFVPGQPIQSIDGLVVTLTYAFHF